MGYAANSVCEYLILKSPKLLPIVTELFSEHGTSTNFYLNDIDDKYVNFHYSGKWYQKENELFLARLAEYADGQFVMVGEDNSMWGYTLKNGKAYYHNVKITFDQKNKLELPEQQNE